jgi:hypothetical protein
LAREKEHQAGKQTTPPGPVVLAINICDAAIRDELTKKVSLIGLFSMIWSPSFPCTHPRMHIYLALTGGHGKHEVEVKLIRAEDRQVVMGMSGPVTFSDPLQVVEVNLQWDRVIFGKPGEYLVEVSCDGNSAPLGFRKFHVAMQRPAPPTSGSEAK